eukprot:MONOS_5049.1-p1 / transcript=MONOS_5049.1 / gene=MONOS_5049 / organism=Monocercomonoides_exilis_PA203 / gene_product=unspecified product / transcript_product=unspecified product / location=Mono_scaffold00143:4817-6202(-) / protein_length=377 / sequence_SO=supercontig / SO=protein_coding / is_pseudo=false
MQGKSICSKFTGAQLLPKSFYELERFSEEEQKLKIEELNKLMDEMNKEELDSILTAELFDRVDKMIGEKKISLDNVIWLLKHIGYCAAMENVWNESLCTYSLFKRFENMIFDEEMKKEGKNEKLIIDLCECYISLSGYISFDSLSICVPHLLKAASIKEINETKQKEVEMTLITLRRLRNCYIERKLYLDEIAEIIKYCQEHHNLTRLAYQSAWQFLILRFWSDGSLKDIIVNELHFVREAIRELEELSKSRNEEYALLIDSIVQVFRAAKANYMEISRKCICIFGSAGKSRAMKTDDLLKGRAIDAVLEVIQRPMLDDEMTYESLMIFMNISKKLKEEKEKGEKGKEERKVLKRKVFDKMEEEGYEDIIIFQIIL